MASNQWLGNAKWERTRERVQHYNHRIFKIHTMHCFINSKSKQNSKLTKVIVLKYFFLALPLIILYLCLLLIHVGIVNDEVSLSFNTYASSSCFMLSTGDCTLHRIPLILLAWPSHRPRNSSPKRLMLFSEWKQLNNVIFIVQFHVSFQHYLGSPYG